MQRTLYSNRWLIYFEVMLIKSESQRRIKKPLEHLPAELTRLKTLLKAEKKTSKEKINKILVRLKKVFDN